MSSITQPGSGMWCYTVQQDKETELYIAHCLNLHVKAGGRTSEEAYRALAKVVKAHYEYCHEFDPDGLSLTAPEEDWTEYRHALEKALKDNPDSIKIEVLELKLRAPQVPERTMPLSCQRVEIAEQIEVATAC